ncbi:MAG: PspA-associated protein PspAA [Solirubrobacteraceae bacterium]
MIVRIATEGQYEVGDDDTSELNELDNAAVAACDVANEEQFRHVFDELLRYIRTKGTAVADDQLFGSDIILPPPDVSLAEARSEFLGEGLIPG